jgi:hypothetical protein
LSLGKVKSVFGDVQDYSYMIRTAEAYFREGGTRFIGIRAVGPAATKADLDLSSSAPAVVVAVTAISEGEWAHEITFTVTTTTGSNRQVVVKQDGAEIINAVYADADTLIDDIQATGLMTATLGVGTWPIANLAETALSGGDDDRASVSTTQIQAGLDSLTEDHGVGSVCAPGFTTSAVHQALLNHGANEKRFALCDGLDVQSTTTLVTAANVIRTALGKKAGYGQMLVPWEVVPGPGIGTVTIPPCGPVAGRMARADRENTPGPGQPAAGRFAPSRFSVDVTREWTKDERDVLSEAGVNVTRNIKGVVQTYDALTLADQEIWPQYAEANGMRVVIAIYSECLPALDKRVLQVIDGKRHILKAMEKDLNAICDKWWARDALYGNTADEAFQVDTGPGVNPDEQLAARHIAAQLELRTSPFASTVDLLITKVAASDVI